MDLILEEVAGAGARRRFVELARRFRGGAPVYVPPVTGEVLKLLDPRRNPALKTAKQVLWIARDQGGKARGRIAATFDPRHAESLGERAGWFGFFDADGPRSTELLLAAAAEWLHLHGASSMLGPADPDTNHECGCLIEGHQDLPYLMMPHQPREYSDWLEAAGLRKAKDLLAYETDVERMREPLARMAPIVRRSLERGGFRIVPVSKRSVDRFLETVRQVYNTAWRDNWGFLPMSAEEFAFEAAGLKFLLDPGLAKVALHEERPAGFILGLPDANLALHAIGGRLFPFGLLRLPFLLRKVRRFRTIALGVVPEYRNRGLDSALVYELSQSVLAARRYTRTEMSWVLEDNLAMNRLAAAYCGTVARRYRIYRRDW